MENELALKEEYKMPMFFYGNLQAAVLLLDSFPNEGSVLPQVVKEFAVYALNQSNGTGRKNVTDFEKRLCVTPAILQQEIKADQFASMNYQRFNCLMRRRLEEAMCNQQIRAEAWMKRLVCGVAVTGAEPGRTFDALWGFGK